MSKTNLPQALNQAISLIRKSNAIYLATHIRPDGDALGSLLGLAFALERQGHRVTQLCADPVPSYYAYLPGADAMASTPPAGPADLGIVVDCDGLKRVGALYETFVALPHLIDIDHHATGQTFGDVVVIDATAAATSEIVYELLLTMGSEITPDIATCLYSGILTDTGRFAFSNTTARSFEIATALIRAGADPAYAAEQAYFQRTLASVQLLGVALSRLSLHCEGRVISTVLYLPDFIETGAVHADTEGIIDQVRTVGGPVIAALFTEVEGGETRVSLRSNGHPEVSRIALRFGGGGHAAAAGCTIAAPPEAARAQVLAAVAEALAEGEHAHAG